MKNVCIVGYGAIGPVHARAVSKIDCARVWAICDINASRADKGAAEYGAKAVYSFDECLEDEKIDVVHICTPHYLHFEMVTKALDAGKRVVVEKPVAMKKEEFCALLSKYDTSRVFPIVQNRTNASIEKLKEISDGGDVGKLLGVKGILTWFRDKRYYGSGTWRGTWEHEGGGVLINQAVHTLDLMTYFAGDAECVRANMSNKSLDGVIEVEDTVDAFIKFRSGARGVFYATNAYVENTPAQLEFVFEKKKFLYIDGRLISDGECICTDDSDFVGKKYWGNGHEKTIYDFYNDKTTLCVRDVKASMDALFAIYESARQNGKEISL